MLYLNERHPTEAAADSYAVNGESLEWRQGMVPGLTVASLHQDLTRHTALVRWAPETRFNPHTHVGGEEILVLDGVFRDEHGEYPAGTWIRSPHLSSHRPFTGPEGALILVKLGHLGDTLLLECQQTLLQDRQPVVGGDDDADEHAHSQSKKGGALRSPPGAEGREPDRISRRHHRCWPCR